MVSDVTPVIVVHGGAGFWGSAEERLEQALIDCTAAAEAGRKLLLEGRSALDAVEAAVRVMEASPVLQAGRGSHRNSAGWVQMDALIADGRTLDLGAVAAVELVPHPISLARAVMEKSPHNFLVAEGASAFADALGIERCELAYLLDHGDETDSRGRVDGAPSAAHQAAQEVGDTVGAVALDKDGNVASATSTGGTKDKAVGRVGDSPLIGSGGYADNWTGAASATGHGEDLMKVIISKRVCDLMATGLSARRACQTAVDVMAERVGGQGGVIAVSVRGEVGLAYNTAAMPHAWAVGAEPVCRGS